MSSASRASGRVSSGTVWNDHTVHHGWPLRSRKAAWRIASASVGHGGVAHRFGEPEIEVFDLSDIFKVAQMRAAGLLAEMPDVQFVLGVKNAMPADRTAFDCCIETTARLMLDAEWCAAGTGRDQLTVNKRYVAAGGHARTGLEENVLLDHDTPAPSNAALVRRVTELCERYERPAASWR